MKALLVAMAVVTWLPLAGAAELDSGARAVAACIAAASRAHQVPAAIIVVLLNVEGGTLGRTSQNTNDTVDIGPMQVNQIWLPKIAGHWRSTVPDAAGALRDNFCANVEAGAWILRLALDEARGDFWEGVAIYHSHAPEHKSAYLRQVLKQVLRLRAVPGGQGATHPAPASPQLQVAGGY